MQPQTYPRFLVLLTMAALIAGSGTYAYDYWYVKPKAAHPHNEVVWSGQQYGNRATIYGPTDIHIQGQGVLRRVSSPSSKIGVWEYRNQYGVLHIYAYAGAMFLGEQPGTLAETQLSFKGMKVTIGGLSFMHVSHAYCTPRAYLVFRWENDVAVSGDE